jgi:hypothetical protein
MLGLIFLGLLGSLVGQFSLLNWEDQEVLVIFHFQSERVFKQSFALQFHYLLSEERFGNEIAHSQALPLLVNVNDDIKDAIVSMRIVAFGM